MKRKVSQKCRVLVVDDEPGIGNVLSTKLRLCGYDVVTTTSGEEAIRLVSAQNPDVMLLDILMPEVTGFDVLDRVRTFSEVPIVVFTARQEIVQKAIENGANDYIGKPFDPDQVVRKIKAVVSKAGQGTKRRLPEAAIETNLDTASRCS